MLFPSREEGAGAIGVLEHESIKAIIAVLYRRIRPLDFLRIFMEFYDLFFMYRISSDPGFFFHFFGYPNIGIMHTVDWAFLVPEQLRDMQLIEISLFR